MAISSDRWKEISTSRFPWERDALDFIRQGLPDCDPYRAWSNFEFIASDGSINEVDLLVFTPHGLFLVEIKSNPGRLLGDAGTWTWENEGKLVTTDNPLISANLKARKLRGLLEQQKVSRKKGQLPFIEALVFCSASDLRCDLQGVARTRVCLRDRNAAPDAHARPGILAAVMRRDCPGLDQSVRAAHDRPMARLIGQAMEQAGIRASQRCRKVGDYVLESLIGEGPGYQDWQATHAQLTNVRRRVRIYVLPQDATSGDRKTMERAAHREFQLLDTLLHPGILRVYGFTQHELGPALVFEDDPQFVRLDHFLAERKDQLGPDSQLSLLRQIAEAVRYAHQKKIVHRALCPQSILVQPSGETPQIKVFNWQVGYRAGTTSSGVSHPVTPTSHLDQFVEAAGTAYIAPEAFADEDGTGEHLDVFSLGAIAYHLFSGVPPAANGLELSNKLRETKGLQISSVLNGACEALQYLIQYSTHPEVPSRTDSVVDFLQELDEVEEELTSPESESIEDPTRAQPGDMLPGDLKVSRRLGQGAFSVVLLVEHNGEDFILKAASTPDHNARIKGEAEVLQKLRHPHIVEFEKQLVLGTRNAFLMRPVYSEKEKRIIETLGQRLRKEGKLHIDLLQRFGEDLLETVNYLEEQGFPHRDIKPDNIAIGMLGRGDKLHLVLFDFSLSRTPPENIRAGTTGYLDPLLPIRKAWDLHAERYAAAVTLYELATGMLPKWGDGATDPSHLDCEITIDAELFEAGLRDQLAEFFTRAFRRNVAERFDNAEEMLRSWRTCFEAIGEPGTLADEEDDSRLRGLLSDAGFDTQIQELGLGTRATNALDRANILTVEDLLTVPLRRLLRLRGVGNKTRREISAIRRMLLEQLGKPAREKPSVPVETEPPRESIDLATLSIDMLVRRVAGVGGRGRETTQHVLRAILGLEPELPEWPTQSDVARALKITRARVSQLVGQFQNRWSRDPAITRIRSDIADILAGQAGAMSLRELTEAVLTARGSTEDEPQRSRLACAVVRAAVEVERTMAESRFIVHLSEPGVLVATTQELASYAIRLGQVADRLADEDPLAVPARAIERLREIQPPAGTVVTDTRLLRMASAASHHAAVSSRQELYPRNMNAARVLKLSQGALLGVRSLTVEQIRERVASRYPEAQPAPDRPMLDDLLRQAGLDFEWDPAGRDGTGCYTSRLSERPSISTRTESLPRHPTGRDLSPAGEVTPDFAEARQFEERLQRAAKGGAFLILLVNPNYHQNYQKAMKELSSRFPVQLVDFEEVFLEALRHAAAKARVSWDLVVKTDATPCQGDWDKLMLLVGRAMKAVEQRFQRAEKTMLLVYAGLLARYDRMDFLERMRDRIGRRDGIHGLWLLVPGDDQALLDGKAIPIISPGQRARIPNSWIENRHRAAAGGGAPA